MNAWLKRPAVQLVLGALVVALVFPSSSAGSISLAIVTGGFGVMCMKLWPHAPGWVREPNPRRMHALAVVIVTITGIAIFWDVMWDSPDWQMGDWGPQRVALQHVMSSMPGFHTPVWNQAAGTGDAPLELYPSLAYLVTGNIAWALGISDLPHAFMLIAVVVHISIAAMTTSIAARLGPTWMAILIGFVGLLDGGAVSHGGTVGLFHYGLYHSAMGLSLSMVAVLGIMAALRKPRLSATIAIWLGTALATACHPAALLGAAGFFVALLAVAALAADIQPRRALVAAGHVAIGIALGAFVWLPLSERLLEYGQHFPNGIRAPSKLLSDLMVLPTPVTFFALFAYVGYVGILVGLWSRRAHAVFVAATAIVLLVGICDLPYLALDLAPGEGVSRLGVERLGQYARPFIFAAAAYGVAILAAHVRKTWSGAPKRSKMIGAAIVAVLAGMTVRQIPPAWRAWVGRALDEAHQFAPDPEGRAKLVAWAKAASRTITPQHYARALFEEDTHEHFHLTAETGMPTLKGLWNPDMLLRERIEDLSPDSLKRFDVRWIVSYGRQPTLGDPIGELQFGSFYVRELSGWDGKFARIERGEGDVVTTRLDDREVDIEVTSKGPVLVALGTGYYPRWQATHESGASEPVYAMPGIPNGQLHVVSAWVLPGKTRFTVDGPLPSDGDGSLLSITALLVAIAMVAVWSRRRWRIRVLRRMARLRARIPSLVRAAAPYAVGSVLAMLVVRGCVMVNRVPSDLEVGNGLRGTATVEARVGDGDWQECGYEIIAGDYRCDDIVTVTDGMANIVNDASPSWAFSTPSIVAVADDLNVHIRVKMQARLAGVYWAGVSESSATVTIDGHPYQVTRRTVLEIEDHGTREVVMEAPVNSPTGIWAFTFVRSDTLLPDRPFLAPPPAAPPAM